jgi:dienelactone hydrolase
MRFDHPAAAWALAALLIFPAAVSARIVEEKHLVPAKVESSRGIEVSRDIMVTFYYDDEAPKPYPALILNHGRAAGASERYSLGRAQYSKISQWLAQRGFMVAVPTRIGYGVTGGDDVEDSGACGNKNYPPGYAAAAAQTTTVLEYLRGRKDVAKDRAIVMGQSYGGATAITVASSNPPGVQAVINFAGGGGGNPALRPGDPCGQPQLKKLFYDYGKTARIPSLWIYCENDQFMGSTLPKVWFEAFQAAGGKGEFIQYPPDGTDGHSLFVHAPEAWQPKVLEFLRAHGYPELK